MGASRDARTKVSIERAELLTQAETEAEIIVSVVRVSGAVTLLAALVIALTFVDEPPPAAIKRQIHVAALVLGSYCVLGIVALVIAAKGRLKSWMPWVFAAVDVGLVIGNTWWSIANPALPQAYVFTAPAIWFAPVVFAFASLRYRPGLQAFMVVTVIVGCTFLIWGVSLPAGTTNLLPRFFDDPPNVIRISMLALCGGILILAAHRRRALLGRAIREAEERGHLQRYLPSQIAPMIADERRDQLQRGWRAKVAIMVIDIRGFTALSETLTPEALGAFVTAYRRHVIDAAQNFDGVIDKFVGDGALIIFGVPETGSDDAARAVGFARALVEKIDAWHPTESPTLKIGIGGHYGEVFAGAVGDTARLEFTVLGDAVNVASRLEELTKLHGHAVIISEDLLQQSKSEPDLWERHEHTDLRGREAPVATFGLKSSLHPSAT